MNVVSAVGSLAGFVRSEQVHPTSCGSARTWEVEHGSTHCPVVLAARVARQAAGSPSGGRLLLQSRGACDRMRRVFSSACCSDHLSCLCSAHARSTTDQSVLRLNWLSQEQDSSIVNCQSVTAIFRHLSIL